MRGWFVGTVLVLWTACYSPTITPGAPCDLALDNCPRGQRCELVGGESFCVTSDGPRPDADAAPSDASMDPDAMLNAWTLVQHEGAQGVNVSFPKTVVGNLIVVGVETNAGGAVTSVNDDAGNSYVRANGSRSVNVEKDFAVEVWYANNAMGGAGTITATAPTVYGVVMWEVDGFGPPDPIGNVVKVDEQASSTTPDGAPITTTTFGEFVVSIVIVANFISGIRNGNAFTNDETVYGNGWAHLTSNTAPPGMYMAEWNALGGVSCTSSVAFRVNP
ncbi:MAG: hypothetical protein ACKV2T_15730 [Kofleriaceae bacterium]